MQNYVQLTNLPNKCSSFSRNFIFMIYKSWFYVLIINCLNTIDFLGDF